MARDKRIYKVRNPLVTALKVLAVLLVIALILAVALYVSFTNYLVYTDEGVRLEIPWLQTPEAESGANTAARTDK